MQLYNDSVAEYIVKKNVTTKEKVCRVLIIVLAVIAGLFVLVLPLMFGITYLFLLSGALVFGIAFFCYYYVTGIEKEYEYSIVNDEFSIDVIRAKSRRTQLYSGSIRQFEMVAKKNDPRHPLSEFDRGDAIHGNCASGSNPDEEWYISTKMGKQKVILFIEPDEKMLQMFYRMNPRNTMYRPTGKSRSKDIPKGEDKEE